MSEDRTVARVAAGQHFVTSLLHEDNTVGLLADAAEGRNGRGALPLDLLFAVATLAGALVGLELLACEAQVVGEGMALGTEDGVAAFARTAGSVLAIVFGGRSSLGQLRILFQHRSFVVFQVVVGLAFTMLPHVLALGTLGRSDLLQVLLDELFVQLRGGFGSNYQLRVKSSPCLDILFRELDAAGRTLDTVGVRQLPTRSSGRVLEHQLLEVLLAEGVRTALKVHDLVEVQEMCLANGAKYAALVNEHVAYLIGLLPSLFLFFSLTQMFTLPHSPTHPLLPQWISVVSCFCGQVRGDIGRWTG